MGAGYHRILVKLSGEGLLGDQPYGIDTGVTTRLAEEIAVVHQQGRQLALVLGGGNIFRGVAGAAAGMDRATADHMGMLATVMNALALAGALEQRGVPTSVLSALPMDGVCEAYARRRGLAALDAGRVVLCAAGTGNPFFTTDTAAVLRAAELKCDVVMKATQVDGVYSADPRRDPSATRYDRLTYADVLREDLQVMDTTAIALAREATLPLIVFNLHDTRALATACAGEGRFTLIAQED